jgi:hypothetical protein
MKCSYHPDADSQEICRACKKCLCETCANTIQGRVYCRDCLIQGAEWVATVRDLRLPSDSPRRAAIFAVIPGIGAVYNNEYLKAIAYFAVFASLVMMGDSVNPVFGFGAFVFLVYTIFDAYRTADAAVRNRLQKGEGSLETPEERDGTLVGWGCFLILLGSIFLLQNIIPYYFLNRLWPAVFILTGAYLIYRAMKSGGKGPGS